MQNGENLWQRFQGKSNTEDILTEKAKMLAATIMDFSHMGVSNLIEYFVKDKKTNLSKDQIEEVLFESVIFYLHFVDRTAFQSMKMEQRNFFMNIFVNDVINIFLEDQPNKDKRPELNDTIHDVYNERQVEYGNYKKLVPEDGKFGGTLFWEFSKKIANVLGFKDDPFVMAEIQTYLVGSLKILQLDKLFTID